VLVDELDFAKTLITIAVNNGPDVTDSKAVFGAIRRERYDLVFRRHGLLHIASYKSRPVVTRLDQPYGQYDLGSLGPAKWYTHFVFLAVSAFLSRLHFLVARALQKGVPQDEVMIARDAQETSEQLGMMSTNGMGRIQHIVQ
jgi:hypothetical protein